MDFEGISIASISSCAPMITDDEVDSVLVVSNGNKMEIVVPFERTTGESSGDSVYEMKGEG